MSGPRRLLIDIGNSQVKVIAASGRTLLPQTLQRWSHGEPAQLPVVDQAYDELLICSVRNSAIDAALTQIPHAQDIPIIRLHSSACHGSLRSAYPQPTQLGVDRWAAMAGAWLPLNQACCVVDLGTATTLDAIDAQGQHLGGWIVPGLATSRESLQQKGQQLQDAGAGATVALANNTADAIATGTINAQAAVIAAFIGQAQRQGLESPHLFLTGGHANTVLGLLSYELTHDPLLVFRGMLALRD
ncbi:MAG: hypothetical protein Tsb002_07310 [Wenzhouxiangellaceae bacterium]